MKQQVILELTKLFVLQRRALSINKSYSAQRIHALIEKKAGQLQACLQDDRHAKKASFAESGQPGDADKTTALNTISVTTAGRKSMAETERKPEKGTNKALTADVVNLQREWVKTKGFLKEMKTICDVFFYDKQNTYGETGEKNLTRKKSRHIESA